MARTAGSNGAATAKTIEEKSLQLFSRYGFAAVSMRMIADAVGVQPGALYQYHTNKQQLLVSLLQGHMEELLAEWHRQSVDEEAPRLALERFSRFHVRYHIMRPDEVFISYMELRSLEPDGFKRIEKLRRTYENILRMIIVAGLKSKDFRVSDPHVCAMAILAMLTGVNTWYRSGGRLSQKKIEDMYVAMTLRCVGCQTTGDGDV